MFDSVASQMIGATITAIEVVRLPHFGDRIDSVNVVTDRGTFIAWAAGDCCANAWIDEIAGSDTVIGGTITGVSTNEKKWDIGNDPYSVLDSFVEVVSTDKGDFAMFTFCEHNGYYSGWINWEK